MDQAALVGVLKPQGRLANVETCLSHRQRAGLLHQPMHVSAFGILHDQEMGVADLGGVVRADQVRMIELGCHADFAVKALDRLGMGQPFFANDLDGDGPVHELMAGLEHLSHAAFAQAFQQQVRSQHQLGAAPLENMVGLVGGQPAALHQLLSEGRADQGFALARLD